MTDFAMHVSVDATPQTGEFMIQLGPIAMENVADALDHLGTQGFRELVLSLAATALAGIGEAPLVVPDALPGTTS